MSVNYDLNNTGPEVQERLDQVFPNRDAISEEEAARQQRDNEIIAQMKAYTDSEQSRAEDAEQGLQAAIDSEQSRAEGAERGLQGAISAEQSRAEDAEQSLRDYTDVETARAQAIERGLQGRIDTLDVVVGEGGSVDGRISEAVASETQRATTVEATKADKSTTYSKVEVDAMIPDVSDLLADAKYDSTNQKINFLNSDGEIVATVNASEFIKDGMVDTVTISGGNLVITFNTDSGKQPISIALTDIFDPGNYYTKTQVDGALDNKVDKVAGKGLSTNDYDNVEKQKLANVLAIVSGIDERIDEAVSNERLRAVVAEANKADKATTYTKAEVNDALSEKVDKINGKGLSTNDYSNTEKQRLADVVDAVGSGGDIDTRITNAVSAEASRAQGVESGHGTRIAALEGTVGSGGSIDNRIANAVAAEKERAQNEERTKANINDVEAGLSTKQDIISDLSTIRSGAALGATAKQPATTIAGYGIEDAYTKQEVNALVSTPNQNFVTVSDYASLPETGSDDTIYRVSNYDGSHVDASKYAEYSWNGTAYVLLAVKSSVGEVFDVSAYNSGATYDSLTLALAAIPASVMKGGMSIKFIKPDPATYSVVKTEGITEQPAGTELESASAVISGTYNASQLSDFSNLPESTGRANAVTYYVAVTETVDEQEVTTYTTWVITKATNNSQEYMQYRLMTANWSENVNDWQGVDYEPTADSHNLVMSGGIYPINFELYARDKDHVYNKNAIVDYFINDYGQLQHDITRVVIFTKVLEGAEKIECKYGRSYSFYSGYPDFASGSNFIGKIVDNAAFVPVCAKYVAIIILKTNWELYDLTITQDNTNFVKISDVNNAIRSIPIATEEEDGLMSSSDKTRIDNTHDTVFSKEIIGREETDESAALLPYTENKGVNYKTGAWYNSEVYKCSKYAEITGYNIIRYKRPKTENPETLLGMAFYDENRVYISGQQAIYSIHADGYVETEIGVPENAKYVRLSENNDIENWGEQELIGIKYIYKDVSNIDILDRRVGKLEDSSGNNTLSLSQTDIVEGNIITHDGNFSPNSNMGCTDYIPCHDAESLTYKRVVGVRGAGLAFYDENKEFLSYIDSISGNNGLVSNSVEVPSNAYYFRASCWNYTNSLEYGDFSAILITPYAAVNGKRASNGESTFFSVIYNSAIDDLSKTDFGTSEYDEFIPNPSQVENYVCTTGVVLLPPNYTPTGKPCRVIVNFHGWSHFVNYKQWGAAGEDYLGFMIQKHRWADAGYAVIDVNHKNSAQKGNYSGLGSIQDDECYRKALEWVCTNYNVEKSCFVVCGSAGGPNGINACYNWPDVRAGVWLDTWIDVSEHPYVNSCGTYYYGYTEEYDAAKVGTRNPMSRIKTINGEDLLVMPKCPVKLYPLTITKFFMKPFIDIINAGRAVGDFYIRKCSSITHSNLVSGGAGNDPQSAVVDEEIINFLNQH